jgi:hypothetical protein
MIFCNERQ